MDLSQRFCSPPREFRQAPFWFWNHRLDVDGQPDIDTLGWQIEQMKEKGLGGFVMHARHGLLTEYLSDAWFECIRFSCEKARELNMMAWAYDERDWPSGPAGGEVIADPENRLSYLRLAEEEVHGPVTISIGGEVEALYVEGDDGAWDRVTASEWTLSEGACRVLRAERFECPAILWFESYLDTLSPKACRNFIRSTYDLHEKRLGDLKDLGLAGFFTDEPAFSTYPDDLRRLPWTGTLLDVFRKQKAYDLLDWLPELFSPGSAGAQIRFDYWDVATTLFERSFFKAIESWCDSRGLQLIGHPLGEEPLFYQFRCLGNAFRYLSHLHMPGMDHLTIQIGKGRPGGLVPKIISSAALLGGRERTMTETFGESGWGLTLREMKWMSDWQIANGINYFIPHAFYYSVAGRRKKDSPPSEFYQTPHWPWYRRFADYTARLTAALTGGEHVAKIAVLYPMSSVWTDFAPGTTPPGGEEAKPEEIEEVDGAFRELCETLQALHRDFLIVDEESFAKAKANEEGFTINGLQFQAVVVPPLTAIRREALTALKRVAKGAVALVVGEAPVRIIEKRGPKAEERVELAGLRRVSSVAQVNATDLEQALELITPDVVISDTPEVLYLHRRNEGKDLYFFANTSDEPVEALVSVETVGSAEVWDAEDGSQYPVPGQREIGGRLEMPLSLAPFGSRLIVVEPGMIVPTVPVENPYITERIEFCELWHFTPENGNFLTLKNWNMTARNCHHVTELHYAAQFVLPERIANLRLILDGVPEQAYGLHEAARPIMAGETDPVILLDGEPLTEELFWEVDPQFRVLDMRGRCGAGTHILEVVIKNNGWFPQPALAEYAWLAGDFAIDREQGVPTLVPVRGIKSGQPWEDQGFPFFSGTGAYLCDLDIPAELIGKRMFINAGNVGSLLEIEVNGATAGARLWPPYRIEVTDHVRAGANLFTLRVSNTARNFFEGPDKDRPSGLLDGVYLEVESG